MAGGFPVDALEEVTDKLLPVWDMDRHPAVFLALTGCESGRHIAPLEPDIIGEHFVLTALRQKNLSDASRRRLSELAWRFNPLGMTQFIVRVTYDFRLQDPAAVWVLRADLRDLAPRLDNGEIWGLWALATAASFGGKE